MVLEGVPGTKVQLVATLADCVWLLTNSAVHTILHLLLCSVAETLMEINQGPLDLRLNDNKNDNTSVNLVETSCFLDTCMTSYEIRLWTLSGLYHYSALQLLW